MTRLCWAGKVAANASAHHESAAKVEGDLQQGGGFLLALGDNTVGSVRWARLEEDASIWEMMRMGVLPAWRGQDLSRHLLQAVVQHANANNCRELRLAVRADQPRLLSFYADHGFEPAPELTYSHANPLDAPPNVMRRFLPA
jgi:GNAT superfamily N-acetyltransferase